jgi:hypothetical protein
VFDQKTVDPKRTTVIGLPFPQIGIFSFNAIVVDTEIDEFTGQVAVKRAWSAGRRRARGQSDAGGGPDRRRLRTRAWAGRSPRRWFGTGPRLANPTLMDYKIPTFAEAPYELNAIIVESHEPSGPFGAKSVGEIGINAGGCGHYKLGWHSHRDSASVGYH